MVAPRPPSFRLGTVWPCIPSLRLGLGAELGNFPGPRERTSQTPFGAPSPGGAGDGAGGVLGRMPRPVFRAGGGCRGGAGCRVGAGLGGRGQEERKGQLRTSKTAPPPTRVSLHPKAFGSGAQMSRGTKGREKKALKGGGESKR